METILLNPWINKVKSFLICDFEIFKAISERKCLLQNIKRTVFKQIRFPYDVIAIAVEAFVVLGHVGVRLILQRMNFKPDAHPGKKSTH